MAASALAPLLAPAARLARLALATHHDGAVVLAALAVLARAAVLAHVLCHFYIELCDFLLGSHPAIDQSSVDRQRRFSAVAGCKMSLPRLQDKIRVA